MGRKRTGPPALDPAIASAIERALDRLEERLAAAAPGLHRAGAPAQATAIEGAGLPPAAALFYRRFDGVDISGGDASIHACAQILAATRVAESEQRLLPGDLVVGEAGRDLFVLPEDPWAEGADVVLVDEAGDRMPEASTLAHLALALVGEAAVMYDDEGEFRDDIFGDDGELLPSVQRRILRRRLDLDPDAPHARLRLAKLLLRDGEARAAKAELRRVIKNAPTLAWAHHELARSHAALGDQREATRAHAEAANVTEDPSLRAYFFAWAARVAEGDRRSEYAQQVLALRPRFAAEQVQAAHALLDDEDHDAAREVIALGLAVAPTHLELLDLRGRLVPGPDAPT